MMQTILAFKLRLLARLYVWRYRPQIVAVTGNTGKTTTKEAITAVLATRYRVRCSGGNLNNELGVPLTVIGDFADRYYEQGGTVSFWFRVFWSGWIGLFMRRDYPDVLVLEFGADRPGDIARLARRYRPHIGVITHIGEVPVHVEFFASPQELAQEKEKLISGLGTDGTAVLGTDDLTVLEMRSRTDAHVITFGIGEGSDVRITDVKPRVEGSRPLGMSFDIEAGGAIMPVSITGAVGEGIARAAAAAVAVGSSMHVGLADAVQAISRMPVPPGRMRIIEGIRGTVIVDDTYNASPAATHLAIDTVRRLPAPRRVLVLGDMLELGSYSVQAHQAIGTMAAEVADVLVCVGESARFIADAAANQLPSDRVVRVPDSREAGRVVQQLLRSGDLVLVKGSQGVRMERIIQEIMARPEDASRLLVRQSARWLAK